MALSCNDAVMRAAVLMSWATGPCRTIAMLRNCAPGRTHSLLTRSFLIYHPIVCGVLRPHGERERTGIEMEEASTSNDKSSKLALSGLL